MLALFVKNKLNLSQGFTHIVMHAEKLINMSKGLSLILRYQIQLVHFNYVYLLQNYKDLLICLRNNILIMKKMIDNVFYNCVHINVLF